MTVHVLMPVFNRLELTQSMLECLRAQRVDEPLSILVVNDGSTDGTAVFLNAQKNITVLEGDGSLWWGGSIDLALRHVLDFASERDWVLLVNNDTKIERDFVQTLLDVARRHPAAAVGSVIRAVEPPHRLLSIGPRINPWRLRIEDFINDPPPWKMEEVVTVDALSGRGTLYPVSALRRVEGMRPRCLPHYLADYELSLRVRNAGWRLLVSTSAAVYSENVFGNAYRAPGLWDRLFSVRSPSYLPAQLCFWWTASNFAQRLTLPLRVGVRALLSLRRSHVVVATTHSSRTLGSNNGLDK
jgi:N-acetylglucosaminyl-diphospho-decaprenol L-rhamnosyltransferase